jgi:hypothetical protein
LKHATFATVLKTVVAANARLLASLLVKPVAVLLISSARTKTRTNLSQKDERENAHFLLDR